MIFATVGTQLPFPRLIDALDRLAPDLDEEIIAQTGPQAGRHRHIDQRESLTPEEFDDLASRARLLVGHAGVGTILTARRFGKPLVLVPRRYDHGEHRNDHQTATARQVEHLPGMYVAWTTEDLGPLLGRLDLVAARDIESAAHAALIARVRAFIAGESPGR